MPRLLIAVEHQAGNWEKFLAIVQVEKSSFFRFCYFTMLQKQTQHWELNSFTNMVIKLDINILKI